MRAALLALACVGCGPTLPAARPLPLAGRQVRAAHVFSFGVSSPDETLLYVVNDGKRVDAVELATGTTRWTSDAPAQPVIAVEDGLFAVMGDQVVAMRATSAAVIWSSDAIRPGFFTGIDKVVLGATRLEGDLYLTSPGSGMTMPGDFVVGHVAIDLATARVQATASVSRDRDIARRDPSPLMVGGLLLVVRTDREVPGTNWVKRALVALEPATGATRWTHPLPSIDETKWALPVAR